MRNIKLTVQYEGTRYSGWQCQKNARALQEVIGNAIKKITGKRVNLVGSGRTDAGVHARGQIANFKTRSKIPLKNIQLALNTVLPKDIVISGIEEAGPSFDSQRSAKSKLYRYTIANENFVDPFMRRFAAKCFYRLDLNKMREAAGILKGRHDFKGFKTNDGCDDGSRNTVRTIKNITVSKSGKFIYIDVEAGGFLYNMVRSIAGTLIEVGRGKMAPGRVKEILQNKDRRMCGPTAPAKGLCLIEVKY